ncbi:MAG: NAD-dependent epimerase/dehydratase family protein [Acidimicrobiales bacterium]
MSRHVVLGAGPIGVSVGERLSGEHDVAVFSIMGNRAYDMVGTSVEVVDATVPAQLARVCEGAEVVYLCLNAHYVEWAELFPPRLDAAIEVAERVGAKLVYHDCVYGYDISAGIVDESTAQGSKSSKGRLRSAMAATFLRACGAGRIRGVIGRSADVYGPGALNSSFNSTLGERHFSPLLAGKPVSVLGDIDQPHTYAFVPDVARGLATLGRDDDSSGEVWHIPAAPTLSHRELLTIAFEVAGLPVKIRASKISGYVVRVIGRFQADLGQVAEMLDHFEQPLEVSHRKFEAAFGADPTPHEVAMAETMTWYRWALSHGLGSDDQLEQPG